MIERFSRAVLSHVIINKIFYKDLIIKIMVIIFLEFKRIFVKIKSYY